MTTVRDMLNRFKQLDVENEVPIIVERTSDQLIELNQSQLYLEGKDSKNQYLEEYRSDEYAEFKQNMNPNPPYARPDLNLTSRFYGGFVVKVSKNKMTFDSTDSKTDDLEAKYGSQIFGLTEENRSAYIFGPFIASLYQYIELVTKLKMS